MRLSTFSARKVQPVPAPEPSPMNVFTKPESLAINKARQDHLATLGLDLSGKTVLEVGAGIGLHTQFFLDRNCTVTITDGDPANVAAIQKRFPGHDVRILNLDLPVDMSAFGRCDIIYCYGTLYHLQHADEALERMASVCDGQILVETIVSPGAYAELHLVTEPPSSDQAVGGIGCRPTRLWVLEALRRHFGYAYATVTRPSNSDFEKNWKLTRSSGNMRAVFVGSRVPLHLPTLTIDLPDHHLESGSVPA